MPLLMTDVSEGAKAAQEIQLTPYETTYKKAKLQADTELTPLRAQEEKARLQSSLETLPSETKRIKLTLESAELQVKQSAATLQKTLEANKTDKQVRDIAEETFKNNPELLNQPVSKSLAVLSKAFLGKGMVDIGENFAKDAVAAEQREAAAELFKDKLRSHKLDKANTYITSLEDDGSNVEATKTNVLTEGVLSEPEYRQFAAAADKAKAENRMPEFKARWGNILKSIEQKRLDEKTEKDRADSQRRARELEQKERNDDNRNNRLAVALASKDDKQVEAIALKQYTDSSNKVVSTQRELRLAETRLAALLPVPKKSSTLGIDTTPEDTSAEARVLLKNRIKELTTDLKDYKEDKQRFGNQLSTNKKKAIDSMTPSEPKSEGSADAVKTDTPSRSATTEKPIQVKTQQEFDDAVIQIPPGQSRTINDKVITNTNKPSDKNVSTVYQYKNPEQINTDVKADIKSGKIKEGSRFTIKYDGKDYTFNLDKKQFDDLTKYGLKLTPENFKAWDKKGF